MNAPHRPVMLIEPVDERAHAVIPQLNNPAVQAREDPWPPRVEAQPLHPIALRLKLGQHCAGSSHLPNVPPPPPRSKHLQRNPKTLQHSHTSSLQHHSGCTFKTLAMATPARVSSPPHQIEYRKFALDYCARRNPIAASRELRRGAWCGNQETRRGREAETELAPPSPGLPSPLANMSSCIRFRSSSTHSS